MSARKLLPENVFIMFFIEFMAGKFLFEKNFAVVFFLETSE